MIASSPSHLVLELGRFQTGFPPLQLLLLAVAVAVAVMVVQAVAVANFAGIQIKRYQRVLSQTSQLVQAAPVEVG
jgi:uncharacterized OsmC-like protein